MSPRNDDAHAAAPVAERAMPNLEADAVSLCCCLHMVQFVVIGSFLSRAITPPIAFCVPSVCGDRWPPRARMTRQRTQWRHRSFACVTSSTHRVAHCMHCIRAGRRVLNFVCSAAAEPIDRARWVASTTQHVVSRQVQSGRSRTVVCTWRHDSGTGDT